MNSVAPNGVKVHKGNPTLKAAGVDYIFTREQIEERIRCTQDPLYFIEKYMKIVHVDRGLVPFSMYSFQKELLRSYIDNRFTIAKLPRQVGKSTVTIAYILWVVLFGPMQNIAILANKASTARDILSKLRLAYEHIPMWMQQGVHIWNKGSIELENGSKVIAAATASSSARGNTFNVIFLDEFAFVPQNIAEEFITSVYPTISSGNTTKVIMVSTPNGMNLFYRYWTDAINGRNLYKPIEAHWSVVPGRDEKWAEDQIKQLGREKFDQEFNTEFLGSTNTLISGTKLKTLSWVNPVKKIADCLDIYEDPKPNHIYVISVDTSEGQNLDYSAFTVVDVSEVPYKIVAKYYNNKISPMVFPSVIYNTALRYNSAHCLVESNSIGSQVVDLLHKDLEYENVFATTNMGRGGQRISAGFRKNAKLGIKMTTQIKSIGCANLKELIETNKLLIQDYNIITELTSFVSNYTTYSAEPGCHDDLVMTLVMFSWLTTQAPFKDITNINVRAKITEEKIENMQEEILPFGYINDSYEPEKTVDSEGNVWEEVSEDDHNYHNLDKYFWQKYK
ncbi:MAG: terminase large subunit domain-containing protein [Bacteroidota bacterium]|jgi:hypothetical protein